MTTSFRTHLADRHGLPVGCILGLWIIASGCQPRSDVVTVAMALLPSELPVCRSVLADFERMSGIRVVVVPQQYADIRRALAAEALAGSGTLDLVELDVYSLSLAASQVAPFDSKALAPEVDVLAPAARRVGEIDGLRFLPLRVSWQALIYNHTVLGAPPTTWDELLAVARAHPQQIGMKAALYEGLTCDLLPFVWSAGGSGSVLDDPGAITAFRFLAELSPYLAPQSQTFKESTITEAMARGEIVLHFDWPFAMSMYAAEGLAPDPIRSAPFPLGPSGRATVLGGGYIAVPRSAPHPAAAVLLAHYLIGASAQERLHRGLGWFSARRDIAVADSTQGLEGFVEMRSEVRGRPELADYPRLSRLWQQAFRKVVFEGADPAATLHAAARELAAEVQ